MEIEVLNFTNVGNSEIVKILEWRNHPIVRQFSNNHEEISVNEHKAFIDKLRISNSREYYFVKLRSRKIGGGVIHFNDITADEANIGLYKDLESEMHKVGEILMDIIMIIAKEKGLKKLKLDVLKNNGRALVLYGRYKFRIINEDDHSYYMEKILYK
jgi:UDP-4-amino-4,6-dideoxy-N-acetyl-beta-L-altrosamine N-acetyltransferase